MIVGLGHTVMVQVAFVQADQGICCPFTDSFNIAEYITKTCLFQIYRKFHLQKLKIFRQNYDIFHISAKNIDCGYSLELPR